MLTFSHAGETGVLEAGLIVGLVVASTAEGKGKTLWFEQGSTAFSQTLRL